LLHGPHERDQSLQPLLGRELEVFTQEGTIDVFLEVFGHRIRRQARLVGQPHAFMVDDFELERARRKALA